MWASAKSVAWPFFGRYPPCRPVDGLFCRCKRLQLRSTKKFPLGLACYLPLLFLSFAAARSVGCVAFSLHLRFRVGGCGMDGWMGPSTFIFSFP